MTSQLVFKEVAQLVSRLAVTGVANYLDDLFFLVRRLATHTPEPAN